MRRRRRSTRTATRERTIVREITAPDRFALQATCQEYAAFDALPDTIRQIMREAPVEMSARKTLKTLLATGWDVDQVEEKLITWLATKTA